MDESVTMIHDHNRSVSCIATPYGAVLFLVLAFVSVYGGFGLLGGFLLFVALVSISAYGWGQVAVHGVKVTIQGQTHQVYPGQSVELHYTLKNEKCLPLLWLELVQPYPPNGCLQAPEEFQVCKMPVEQEENLLRWVLCKRFSFIKWYAALSWTSVFQAVHRGVYHPEYIDIYTGDGFGLTVRTAQKKLDNSPVFVVYPQRVAVSTAVFFKNIWSASTGSQGTVEDVSVLRSTRDYLPQDYFKRINWRLAARGGPLSVNVYQRIAPRAVYFFVDTATFAGISPDNQAFEHTLSVVGSLISELFAQGMAVALYLPGERESTAFCVDLEQTSAPDCLLALALCDCTNPKAQFSQQSVANLLAGQAGSIYYVCYDQKTGRFPSLFEEVGISRFSIISHQEQNQGQASAIDTSEISVYQVSDFQRGGL